MVDADDNGCFIVFEGIDGAGTTTQLKRYAEHLREEKRQVHITREPSDGSIGALLRLTLGGRVSMSSVYQAQTMALLFAADRLDHLAQEIDPNLRDGAVVLSDRYDLSSIIYQSATMGEAALGGVEPLVWLREINRCARRPHATVVLRVSAAEAERRRRSRAGAPELYELSELQHRLADLYADAEAMVPGDRIIYIDGEQDADAVAAEVRERLALIVKR